MAVERLWCSELLRELARTPRSCGDSVGKDSTDVVSLQMLERSFGSTAFRRDLLAQGCGRLARLTRHQSRPIRGFDRQPMTDFRAQTKRHARLLEHFDE